MLCCTCFIFFFKQKTAYEMRISDWSSDVCSSDLSGVADVVTLGMQPGPVRMFSALTILPEQSAAEFDARHPQGADYVIVPAVHRDEIGRASCRERVCQYV